MPKHGCASSARNVISRHCINNTAYEHNILLHNSHVQACNWSVLRPVQVTLTLSDDPHLSPDCVARGAVIRIDLKFQHPNVELILHASIICSAPIS